MKKRPDLSFKIDWQPFFLNSRIPESGMSWTEYMQQNYGGRYDLSGARARLKQVGVTCGIDFQFKEDQLLTPTLRSHRLVEFAKRHNKLDEVMEGIFHMYFEKSIPLNSVDGLVGVAKAAGLDEAKTRAFLTSDEDADDVKYKAIQWAQGISGVPFFLFSAKGLSQPLAFSGAQPIESFLRVFDEVFKRAETTKSK